MEATDLMIGNYAFDKSLGIVIEISPFDRMGFATTKALSVDNFETLEPIPLDEEQLDKLEQINCISKKECAYELIFDKYRKLTIMKSTIDNRLLDVYLWVDFNDEEGNKLATRIDIKYVHQLQNYYYWNKLTSKQLKYKKYE